MEGLPRRRVRLVVEGAPTRHGAKIFDPATNELLGSVTSGIPSPTLGQNIVMGCVQPHCSAGGTSGGRRWACQWR
ncbi:hypothetical protein DFH07DRAFT_862715 [Mycena maculata]|uniref:Aminomethyltransferase C-terminal domain-containing protein n=1 Tax=Mycena maculata TaxID=230809 RepID=A0AAD7HAW4_9AGAR|nr:hypothetical protein DFH07DRAFT_862715 [Mycena maculata]